MGRPRAAGWFEALKNDLRHIVFSSGLYSLLQNIGASEPLANAVYGTLPSLRSPAHIRTMAKSPESVDARKAKRDPAKHSKKDPAKPTRAKAARPDLPPIEPALADLLNPAIGRGAAGPGSQTGL